MESKFSVLLAFAIFIQCCFAATSTQLYGLSEKDDGVFKQILTKQDETVKGEFDGYDTIFKLFNTLTSGIISNVTCENNPGTSAFETALARLINATDESVEAITLALGPTADIDRKELVVIVKRVFELISKAITLVTSGQYSERRSEFDEYQSSSRQGLAKFVDGMFKPLFAATNTTDKDASTTVKTAARETTNSLHFAINAVFNTMRLYANAYANRSADTSLTLAIENMHGYSRIGLRNAVEYEYSMIKTLFLKDRLKLDIPLSTLYSIQYGQTVSTYRFETGNEALFETVENYVTSSILGLSDVGYSEFSLTDFAKAVTTAHVKLAFRALLDSVVKTDSIKTDVASAYRQYFDNYSIKKVEILYSTLNRAQKNETLPVILAAINALEKEYKTKGSASVHVGRISDLILDGKKYGHDFATRISAIKDKEIKAIDDYTAAIFNVARFVAKTRFDTCAHSSETIRLAISDMQKALFDAIDLFNHKIAELRIIVKSENCSAPGQSVVMPIGIDVSATLPISKALH